MTTDIDRLIEDLKSFDWKVAHYDPLHDTIEASTPDEIADLHRMEKCISDLQQLHKQGKSGKIISEVLVEQFWRGRPMEDQISTILKKYSGQYQLKGNSIDNDVLRSVRENLEHNNNWVAYNSPHYFIGKDEVYFFKHQDEAEEFSSNNISDWDDFTVVNVTSQIDFIIQVNYGDYLKQELSLLETKNLSTMNQENLEYLKDNIKYMGFGEKLNESLEHNLKAGKPEFQLTTDAKFNNKVFEAKLNFRRSDSSEMYFFNSYNASLTRSNGDKMDQTFYLNKGKGVTAKEAYNLLEGRAVHKELSTKDGQDYKAWLQLDLQTKDKNNNFEVKQFHENYGFDLKASLSKYPISELNYPDQEKSLLQSLQKGNVQSVTMEKDGKESKLFVEANPQFKTITVYDSQMKRLQKEDLNQYLSNQQSPSKVKQDQKEEIKQDKSKGIKKTASGDELGGTKQKGSKKKGMSI